MCRLRSSLGMEPTCHWSLTVLIDVDRRRNCESVGATGEAQFAADSHVEHARGCTDAQVDLVFEIMRKPPRACASLNSLPRRYQPIIRLQYPHGHGNDSSTVLGRSRKRAPALPQSRTANHPLSSVVLTCHHPAPPALAVIVQASRCSDPNSSPSVSRTSRSWIPQSIRLSRFAWQRLPGFRARQVRRCCSTASLECVSRLPR